MKRINGAAGIAAAILLVGVGCASEPPASWGAEGTASDQHSLTYSQAASPLNVGEARLKGDYGGVVLSTLHAATVTGMMEHGYATVDLVSQSKGGASMAALEFLTAPAELPIGTHGTWRWDDWDALVVGIGCAGDLPFNWDFDAIADEVTLSVVAKPGHPNVRVFEFVAVFDPASCGFSCMGSGKHAGSKRTELMGRFELVVE
ncbi:MAG: hypothetical protein ACI9WU_000254 [Myxococcota bacterium]|jgi:hypothetical protein